MTHSVLKEPARYREWFCTEPSLTVGLMPRLADERNKSEARSSPRAESLQQIRREISYLDSLLLPRIPVAHRDGLVFQ